MAAIKKSETKAAVKKVSKGATKKKMSTTACCKPGIQVTTR